MTLSKQLQKHFHRSLLFFWPSTSTLWTVHFHPLNRPLSPFGPFTKWTLLSAFTPGPYTFRHKTVHFLKDRPFSVKIPSTLTRDRPLPPDSVYQPQPSMHPNPKYTPTLTGSASSPLVHSRRKCTNTNPNCTLTQFFSVLDQSGPRTEPLDRFRSVDPCLSMPLILVYWQ